VSYKDRARRKAQLLREMLRDIRAGRYKPSRGTVAAILFALFYFLFPAILMTLRLYPSF